MEDLCSYVDMTTACKIFAIGQQGIDALHRVRMHDV